MTDLTIPYTLEEVELIAERLVPAVRGGKELVETSSRLAKQLLATMKREEKLRRGLEAVKSHQEMVGGSLAKVGTTWHIADVSLQSCEYSGVETKE